MHAFAHSRRACSAYLFSNIWNVERIFWPPFTIKERTMIPFIDPDCCKEKKRLRRQVREVRTRALAAHGGHRDIND
jgi:hypothetical protein